MEKNNDARITDLEAKIATLQALVSQEAMRSAELRKENEDFKRQVTIFNKAFELTDETFKRVDDYTQWLKEKVESTWKLTLLNDERAEILVRHDDCHGKMLGHAKAMIDAHTDQIKSLQLDMTQMRDAYYHIFPERLKQDVQWGRQFDALIPKPPPDTDSTNP